MVNLDDLVGAFGTRVENDSFDLDELKTGPGSISEKPSYDDSGLRAEYSNDYEYWVNKGMI